MRTTLRTASLATLIATLLVGSLSSAHATSCEVPLKGRYKCSGTYSDGGTSEYCIRTDVITPGDGQFALYEENAATYLCTCDGKGRAPNVKFGGSSRDFFCGSGSVILSGKVSGSRLSGYGYNTSLGSGLRSAFTCQPVATCP